MAGLGDAGFLLPNGRGSPPTSSASSSSPTNDVAKQPGSRELPAGRLGTAGPTGAQYTPHSHQFPRTRKMFDKGPDQVRLRSRPGDRGRSECSPHHMAEACGAR